MAIKMVVTLEGPSEEVFQSFLEECNSDPQIVLRGMFSYVYHSGDANIGMKLWRGSFSEIFEGIKVESENPNNPQL